MQAENKKKSINTACEMLTDAQALKVFDLYPFWTAGASYKAGDRVRHAGVLYAVEQPVNAEAHQPPETEGMLAIYRPIEPKHAGTIDDPIPWAYGMDCEEGLYYIHKDKLYRCAADMKPCTWDPGTEGVWQWEEV